MPTSPNDPDYGDVFDRFREQVEDQRKKVSKRVLTPRGYSKLDPKYQSKKVQESQRQRKKRQEKEQKE